MSLDAATVRRLHQAGVVLLLAVALLLVVAVVPAVRADTYPRGAPERAARAFLANAGVAILAAAFLAWRILSASRRARPGRLAPAIVGVIVLMAGLALVDATGAFGSHGPAMATARTLMGVGAAGELLAGVLILVAIRGRHED